jgi:hypothetical protein
LRVFGLKSGGFPVGRLPFLRPRLDRVLTGVGVEKAFEKSGHLAHQKAVSLEDQDAYSDLIVSRST